MRVHSLAFAWLNPTRMEEPDCAGASEYQSLLPLPSAILIGKSFRCYQSD
jgi:hypothetical protein